MKRTSVARHLLRHAAFTRRPNTAPKGVHARQASTEPDASHRRDWISWLKRASSLGVSVDESTQEGKCLLFAGLGSYPHTPHSPTDASLAVWQEASEALLAPDATIGYFPTGMEEFAGRMRGAHGGASGLRGWMRGWVEGRTLDELMKRPDVTAAFILTSSVAILASAQMKKASASLIPVGTTHLAGHGFVGTLTALVVAGRLDLATGVRLARMYALLPASPRSNTSARFLTTVLAARLFHSLSSPPWEDPFQMVRNIPGVDGESSSDPERRKRAMQLVLDEIHGLQKEWQAKGNDNEWAGASIINSSKVFSISGTHHAVLQTIERLQQLNLANPVMDVHMPCPYNTPLMEHATPAFHQMIQRTHFRDPPPGTPPEGALTILDPISTHTIGPSALSLSQHLTNQIRWHKTLTRLYTPTVPPVHTFLTIGRGAKGLGVMLRGELRKRPEDMAPIDVVEFGVKQPGTPGPRSAPS